MSLLPWQDRVITERAELGEKVEKLKAFLKMHDDPTRLRLVHVADIDLLWIQLSAMTTYLAVLDARVKHFKEG